MGHIVHEPVEDGVGEGRITDVIVPVIERQLAGDESRASADTIVEEFEKIIAFARAEGRDGEVIDHDEIDKRLGRAVAPSEWTAGGAALAKIGRWASINLGLGILILLVTLVRWTARVRLRRP